MIYPAVQHAVPVWILAFLKKHRNNPHVVLIDDISRLARDVKAHIELRAAITMAGGILKSPTLEFSDDADSELQERLNGIAKVPARKNLNTDFPLRGAVVCGDCNSPLTACWSKGQLKHYAYYLCHNQACESYRKSIPRAKIEGEFETLLKELQPTTCLFKTVRAMFKDVWNFQLNSAVVMKHSVKKELNKIERQIEQLLDRIVESAKSGSYFCI